MKKIYKKGQYIKITGKYIPVTNGEDIIVEIIFCNSRSFLVRFNNNLYEIPENAVLCIVESPVTQKPAPGKEKTTKKTKQQAEILNQKLLENIAHSLGKNKPSDLSQTTTVKTKKSRRRGSVHATLIYIPPKDNDNCYFYHKREITSLGEIHDRAYWALTHPYVGGACCPR